MRSPSKIGVTKNNKKIVGKEVSVTLFHHCQMFEMSITSVRDKKIAKVLNETNSLGMNGGLLSTQFVNVPVTTKFLLQTFFIKCLRIRLYLTLSTSGNLSASQNSLHIPYIMIHLVMRIKDFIR